MNTETSWEYQTNSRRSTVFGTKGVVCSTQPLASAAGISILNQGGNAVDAAVAVAAALNVTEPCNCGIGGDVFALFYSAKSGTVHAINGSGRSPMNLSVEDVREKVGEGVERFANGDVNSVTVPGAVGAWCRMVREWGGGKVSMGDVMQPAVSLAEDGFPVHQQCSYEWSRAKTLLTNASKGPGQETYPFLLDGETPKPGQFFTNPALGATLRGIGKDGHKGYYEGENAQAIVDAIQSRGGKMTLDDLKAYEAEIVDPISYTYGVDKHTIWECPPNGQGLAALIAFGIVDALRETGVIDLESLKEGSTEWYHVLIEAMRLGYADAQYWIADPSKVDVPVSELLSKEYLQKRAKLFDTKKANAQYVNGNPLPSSDTVYFSTADAEGNAVSMIMSNYAGFGTGIVPKDRGFTLQNRGMGFILNDDTHPNRYEPGKRPYHTIIPAMVTQGKELVCSYGVMGGYMQPQGHLQVLINLIHHRHHPQAALDAPRFLIGGDRPNNPGPKKWWNRTIALEHGIPDSVVQDLKAMGHDVEVYQGSERIHFGKGQIISQKIDERTGKRVWAAGSDPRGDGVALAQL